MGIARVKLGAEPRRFEQEQADFGELSSSLSLRAEGSRVETTEEDSLTRAEDGISRGDAETQSGLRIGESSMSRMMVPAASADADAVDWGGGEDYGWGGHGSVAYPYHSFPLLFAA